MKKFFVSGRTELAGNHTDHQNGRILAAAIDLGVTARVEANGAGVDGVKRDITAIKLEKRLRSVRRRPQLFKSSKFRSRRFQSAPVHFLVEKVKRDHARENDDERDQELHERGNELLGCVSAGIFHKGSLVGSHFLVQIGKKAQAKLRDVHTNERTIRGSGD